MDNQLSMAEQMGMTYRQEGDYLVPDISLPPELENLPPIGRYGRMRREYLKEHKRILFTSLVLEGKLFPHLLEIEQAAEERMERMIPEMAKAQGVTEQLKREDQMKWVGMMNNIHAQAEEMVLSELIYA